MTPEREKLIRDAGARVSGQALQYFDLYGPVFRTHLRPLVYEPSLAETSPEREILETIDFHAAIRCAPLTAAHASDASVTCEGVTVYVGPL